MGNEEQKVHMENLFKQATELNNELTNLQAQLSAKRDVFLKVQGAIEYLQQIGVSLPEDAKTSAPEQTETAEE